MERFKLEIVVKSTGIFTDSDSLNKHIIAGAKKVLQTRAT
ncbi:MAG: hypothetical protein Ct9H90mP3_5270 [Flammeovirgaceae bacterium]|nr:MAG: hypothetical protein Ct9H90mP3_5270 [Flammeovirgaceae bacterium]